MGQVTNAMEHVTDTDCCSIKLSTQQQYLFVLLPHQTRHYIDRSSYFTFKDTMPKVSKKSPGPKRIAILFEEGIYYFDIFKHFASTEIYRAIQKALPHTSNIRVTDEYNIPLELRFETLHAASRIYAHRSDYTEHGILSQSESASKMTGFMSMIMQNWEVKDAEDTLPLDLRPRLRPLGKIQYATAEDVNLGVPVTNPDTWPAAFVREVYNLSKITVKGHEMALKMLRDVVAERQSSKGDQHRNVYEVMSRDVRKAVASRNAQLKDLASEGYEVAMFTGGLLSAIEEVEEAEEGEEGEEAKHEETRVPHTFVIACRGDVENSKPS